MKIYLYILVMAVTTYLIRALPLLFLKKPIGSRNLTHAVSGIYNIITRIKCNF